jgi:hypothetical protein
VQCDVSLEQGCGHGGSNHSMFDILGFGRSKDQEPSAARIAESRILKSRKVGCGRVDFDISGPRDSKDREQGERLHHGFPNRES